VDRYEQRRSINILGDLSHDRPLDVITKDADAILAAIPKPAGYTYEYRGDEQNRRESFSGFFIAIALGILLIYIILACQFESIIQPMIIMLAIPLSAIGAFLALLITHTTISMLVLMGLLLLTGIVVSNSILLVQVVNVMKGEGASTSDALIRGGRRRLRPILMTAIATLLAMLPMALALREGSGMWRPLGITVIGGLFSSTFLTLLVVPVAYSLVDDLAHKLGFRSAVSTHPVETDDEPKPG
jgi:HAE1 family hydrophobic/amphiphilic exporter-1